MRCTTIKVKTIALLVGLLPSAFAHYAVATPEDAVKSELLKLDQKIDQAFYDTADKAFLDDVLTDDYIYVHSGAMPIETKSDVLRRLTPNLLSSRKRESMDVRLHGDTAIVSGFSTIAYAEFTTLKFHIQRTYIKKQQQWKLAAQHVTLNLQDEKGLIHLDVIKYIYQRYWSQPSGAQQ